MYTLQNSVGQRAGIFIFWIFVLIFWEIENTKNRAETCVSTGSEWIFHVSILIHRLFYVYLYMYLHIYTNIYKYIYIYIYIYYIHILYNKNISIHSIHSIHENEKASKTNEKQRENAFLANSDVSSLHRGIHRSTLRTFLLSARVGSALPPISFHPLSGHSRRRFCRHCRATLSALPGTLIEGLTPSH